jgi:thiol-disulfide isomerase/thioredoxin
MSRFSFFCLLLLSVTAIAQIASKEPTDEKAKKSFAEAKQLYNRHNYVFAVDGFRKADKQDGGHCVSCEQLAYDSAIELRNYKLARQITQDLLSNATDPKSKARAHYFHAVAAYRDGLEHNNEKAYQEASSELTASLELVPKAIDVIYFDGLVLAHLNQDQAAQEKFREYLRLAGTKSVTAQRAQRYIDHPELVRARMAPAFRIDTLNGKTVSLDDLTGKVVLLDFWATWCAPCREALPHVKEIAKRLSGPNFLVLSISLDTDDKKWKDFVSKNEMSWPQARDEGFSGPIAELFAVHAIPHTFVIDADCVLQEEKVGDASIEGKLKKLIAHAQQLQQASSQNSSPTTAQ